MAALLRLNGPPGVGKSTISALWADRHPGTLNLDIDTLLRLVGGWHDIDAFAVAARHAQANFVEIILLVERAEALARFGRRPDTTAWHSHNRRTVAQQGGPHFLGALYDRLLAVAQARPSATVVRSEAGAIEDTYAAVERAVTRRRERPQR